MLNHLVSDLVCYCWTFPSAQAHSYNGETLLAQDKCGEAIRGLQESIKSQWTLTLFGLTCLMQSYFIWLDFVYRRVVSAEVLTGTKIPFLLPPCPHQIESALRWPAVATLSPPEWISIKMASSVSHFTVFHLEGKVTWLSISRTFNKMMNIGFNFGASAY